MSRNADTGSLCILYYIFLGVSFILYVRKTSFMVENYFTDDPQITVILCCYPLSAGKKKNWFYFDLDYVFGFFSLRSLERNTNIMLVLIITYNMFYEWDNE